jgi:hypothetical protein
VGEALDGVASPPHSAFGWAAESPRTRGGQDPAAQWVPVFGDAGDGAGWAGAVEATQLDVTARHPVQLPRAAVVPLHSGGAPTPCIVRLSFSLWWPSRRGPTALQRHLCAIERPTVLVPAHRCDNGRGRPRIPFVA